MYRDLNTGKTRQLLCATPGKNLLILRNQSYEAVFGNLHSISVVIQQEHEIDGNEWKIARPIDLEIAYLPYLDKDGNLRFEGK